MLVIMLERDFTAGQSRPSPWAGKLGTGACPEAVGNRKVATRRAVTRGSRMLTTVRAGGSLDRAQCNRIGEAHLISFV